MNREDALKLLESDLAHDRLRASRFLLHNAGSEDFDAIDRAFRRETVQWTRMALQDVLRRLNGQVSNVYTIKGADESEKALIIGNLDATSEEIARDLYENALDEVTTQILHEIEPLIGVLSVHASEEIKDYSNSETKKQIERLNGLMDAIGEIRKASSPATYRQYDVAEMIKNCSDIHQARSAVEVQLAGPAPFIILGDQSRLDVAFENGLRNAIDATLGVEPAESREPVAINWGSTDDEYWIAILDSGTGLKGNTQRMFDFGTSTKVKHFGVGLPTARQAMASLGGVTNLSSREPVGARFELRWPRMRRTTK